MASRSKRGGGKTRASDRRCIVIAGPNGAGKTTFAREFLPKDAGIVHFVNADLIASGLSPLKPELAAIAAGRLFLKELDRLAAGGVSFAFESTLSGATYASRLRGWKAAGYTVEIVFLRIHSPQLALRRDCCACSPGRPRRAKGGCIKTIPTGLAQLPSGISTASRYLGGVRYFGQCPTIAGAWTMKSKKQQSKSETFSKSVGKALRRSAKRARDTARMHGTPVYVWKDGKIVAEKP